ncbi:hypothetical protein KIN20_016552 [Parelaphostrongylus tenuis]|uniref:Edg1 TPR repeats region domain-containing protein n=1 Tax=Parelaphostrongylus tenuis TaxID=148309 RepID=A0AAD5MHJ5_PARTN|nr:hypothetical protein KIN20_016552 [Parelaphostrongylus tenuis]
MQLFWEVYQLKFIPNLLDSSTLSALDKMTESVEAYIKEIDKNSLSQLRLPSGLLCLFNVEEWDASSNFPAKEPCFFKDVSIQHGRQSETIQNESRAGKDFVLRLNEVLDGVGAGNFDVESMKKLSDFRLETCLPFDDAMQIAYRFTSVLGKLSTWQCDITEAFLTMFENFFQSLSEESKFSVVRLVYERHLPKDDSCLIFLENYIRSYSTDVTKCVNGIGDHNEIQSHPEKFNDIRKKLSWYLFTVPGPTLRRLLSQCLQNKSIVPGVLNILRSCRVLFEFTVKSDKVVGVEYSPILIESIMILFDDEIHRLQSTERQDQFVYLLTSLCRDKRGTAKDKPVTAAEKAILKASVLVRLFVLPNLMQRTHETLMLRLLQRLFQSSGARGVHFEWTVAIGQKRPNAVQTPELLLLVVQLFMEYESKDRQGAELCHSILKNLSKRLRSDDVILTKRQQISFCFLCDVIHGLYKSLSLDQQEQCEQITVDFPFSHAECFFRSLFELALFECDLALEFLRKGIVVLPRDGNLIEKIALALVDSCEQTSYKQNMTSLAPLLSELLRVLDPSQELHFMELLCESTYCGLKLIQHILLIATAVKLAYHKENNSGPTDLPHSHSSHGSESRTNYHVADILLQAFCELAKAHTDKEVISLRQSKLQQPSDIKDDLLPPPHLKVRVDERVYAQIAVLFNVTCSLTRLVPETPASLKVLINCLAEYLFELQNLRAPKFLDDLSSDHYKSNTVYAYANADVKKQENYNEEDCKESEEHSRQKSTSSANESYCVQNELFDKLGTTILKMDTIATARQITGSDIRRLAENRLISGESSVDGKNGKKRRITKRR